jgi:transcriptional regulator
MYIPSHFAQTDPATLHAFIREHSFALLCSTDAEGIPFASHLPLLHDAAAGTLIGHMARANPQWQHADGNTVLAIFSGPHVYVSPSWYDAEQVVPTWNYTAVHITGVFHAIHDHDTLLHIVQDSIDRYEGDGLQAWRLDAPQEYIDRMLKGIVGFRIDITNIEGKWKLSQNQPPERRAKVRQALRREGGVDAEAIAELMERNEAKGGS